MFFMDPLMHALRRALSGCRSLARTILNACEADDWILRLFAPATAFRRARSADVCGLTAAVFTHGQTELKLCHVGYVMLRMA